jgi:signal peptidase I
VLRWRLLAAAASAIVPGMGQWLLGQRARAVVFWMLLLGVVALWWPLRLPMTFWGWMLAIVATFALWVAGAVWALLGFRKSPARPRLLWLIAVVPLAVIVPILLCGWVLLPLSGCRLFHDPSNSMAPAIDPNDIIMVDMRDVAPHEGAPVIFERDAVVFVKRVIGMPGNVVQGVGGNVSVNGAALSEPYVQHTGPRLPNLENFGPVSVPEGQIFVLGDSRDVSLDSRMQDFGTVPIAAITGKPLYVFVSDSPLRIGKTIR